MCVCTDAFGHCSRCCGAVVQQLARAPEKLLDFPRLGKKLDAFEPRGVRRIIVGNYDLRYEIERGTIFILRLWHCRENRSFEPEN